MNKLVTILMPAYNAEKYIKTAIDSILNQSFSEFDFLIINDGSTDDTEKIILSYNDERIKYVKNETNIGLKATLNKGVVLAETKYLARMDADDISLKERVKVQIDFMERNEDVGVCGTWYEIFGSQNSIVELPLSDEDIKSSLLFLTVICHPSVVIRTEVLKKNNITFGFPSEYKDGLGHKILELEDSALWHKLKFVTKFANLNQVLLKYRVDGQNLTSKRLDVILERKKEFYFNVLKEINIHPNEMNLLLHISFKYLVNSKSKNDLYSFKDYLAEILVGSEETKIYDTGSLKKQLEKKWENLFYYLPKNKYDYIFSYIKISKGLNQKQLLYLIKFTFNKYILRKKN